MKTIEITITPTGKTTAETKGFQGVSCQQASEFLTKTLGGRRASSSPPSSTAINMRLGTPRKGHDPTPAFPTSPAPDPP